MTTCPFTLPLTVGTQHGRVSDQIFDAKGQAVLILYGVDSRGSLEEARSMEWNQKGLARGDYVVKAVNEHERLVKRVAELEGTLRETLEDFKRLEAHIVKISDAGKEIQQLIAKPVDRRKD